MGRGMKLQFFDRDCKFLVQNSNRLLGNLFFAPRFFWKMRIFQLQIFHFFGRKFSDKKNTFQQFFDSPEFRICNRRLSLPATAFAEGKANLTYQQQ